MKIFTNLTFLHLISHQLLWLPEKNWFQWCFLKKIWYQKFTSFFQNFHQIPIFECSGPPQTWKNPRKWLKNSFLSGHRFYLGCCKIWANSIELAFLADDPVSLDLAYCALGGIFCPRRKIHDAKHPTFETIIWQIVSYNKYCCYVHLHRV